jgi:hypothetical protein
VWTFLHNYCYTYLMYDVVKYIVMCIASLSVSLSLSLSLSIYLSQPKQANKSLKNPPGYHMYKTTKKRARKDKNFVGESQKVLRKVFRRKAHAKMPVLDENARGLCCRLCAYLSFLDAM